MSGAGRAPEATVSIAVEEHPALGLVAFATRFDRPLCEVPAEGLAALLRAGPGLLAAAPAPRDEEVRRATRDLLRHGGYRPTGRGKPSSEYLVRAEEEGRLAAINAAVDAGNAVALASGVPVSVVDLDRARPPLRVGVAEPGASFVFNPSGQTIDVSGLLCLFDAEGPCANAVKDAQRTKTDGATRATLSVLWGTRALAERVRATAAWYRGLLEELGARTVDAVPLEG